MKKYSIFALLLLCLGVFSCTAPALNDDLDNENHFRNSADARSAILGLYGKFMELAEKTVVLNELRADLMDVTPNAGEELQAISYFTSGTDNSWADPTLFYEVIQNCNDILANFDDMLKAARISEDEYNELYADVMTVRCWIYLRIGTLYGRVPYLTAPLRSVSDVKSIDKSSYLNLDMLIPELISCMESLPTLEQYSTGNELNTTQDGYALSYYTLNKRCLLAELYMFDNQYEKAAKTIRDFHRPFETEGGDGRYKNHNYLYQGEFNGSFSITYTRNMYSDFNSMQQLWVRMFQLGIGEKYANWEHITCLTFDKNFEPKYPFIRLFGTEGVGEYLLMPSQNAVDNFWGAQVQTNGFEFDGRGITGSYVEDAQGRRVIQKYLGDYDPAKPYEQSGRWFVYRTGWLNLLYAEACNRVAESGLFYQNDPDRPYSSYRKLAYGMLNNGFVNQFSWNISDTASYVHDDKMTAEWWDGFMWRLYPADKNGNHGGMTSNAPKDSAYVSAWWPGESGYFPAPYDFDCRYCTTPYHRGPWRDASGIRARASLTNKVYDEAAKAEYPTEVEFLEDAILEEMALETAYEGHRWSDIIRIARRQNQLEAGKGTALLNKLIGQKFEKNGHAAPVFLDDESNWYLPVNFD